jgi:hypothetical protein
MTPYDGSGRTRPEAATAEVARREAGAGLVAEARERRSGGGRLGGSVERLVGPPMNRAAEAVRREITAMSPGLRAEAEMRRIFERLGPNRMVLEIQRQIDRQVELARFIPDP